MQENGHDCGVYVCMFADLLSLGCDIGEITPSQVQNYRKKLAWNIMKDEITKLKVHRRSIRSQTRRHDRLPSTTFEECMRFEVVCRISQGCFLVKDIHIPPSQLPSITSWEVVFRKKNPDTKNNKAMKKLGGGHDLLLSSESESESSVQQGRAASGVQQGRAASGVQRGQAAAHAHLSLQRRQAAVAQRALARRAANLQAREQALLKSESDCDSDGKCVNTEIDGKIESNSVSDAEQEESCTRENPSLSQDHSNLMLLSQAGEIVKDNDVCDESWVENDCKFMPLSHLKLDSVGRKCINFEGTFAFELGDHNAYIRVDFCDESLPVDVVTSCKLHTSTTSDKCFPCKCILEMDHAIRNQKIKWWPSDHAYLYPPAYRSEAVRNALWNHPTDLLVDSPKFSDDLDEILDPKMEAAQKYKHGLSGPRIRSSGEINSSAKKPPKYKREGKRRVSLSDDQDATNDSPPQPPIYYSGNNFIKDPPQKCLPPTTTPYFNVEATGSIFYGHKDSEFILNHVTAGRTITVHDWCKRRNKRREQCNLVSLAGVARSETGEEYVCHFHNVAHVDNQIDDCKRQFFNISEM